MLALFRGHISTSFFFHSAPDWPHHLPGCAHHWRSIVRSVQEPSAACKLTILPHHPHHYHHPFHKKSPLWSQGWMFSIVAQGLLEAHDITVAQIWTASSKYNTLRAWWSKPLSRCVLLIKENWDGCVRIAKVPLVKHLSQLSLEDIAFLLWWPYSQTKYKAPKPQATNFQYNNSRI